MGADWVRQNSELIIGGNWLSESGITDAEQLEITAAPGVIRLQRREDGGFQAYKQRSRHKAGIFALNEYF
ncbi:hypothetical protein WN53_07510 [Serratia fonticola]|nr:hypothetical protein WN53_07510 [Serratia fonticola]